MILDGSDTTPGHASALRTQPRSQRRQGQPSRTARRKMSIFRRLYGYLQTVWIPTPPAPKGEGTEPSVHTTTSDVGRLRRKLAAISDRPGSEREQPTMNVVTVKFRGSKWE